MRTISVCPRAAASMSGASLPGPWKRGPWPAQVVRRAARGQQPARLTHAASPSKHALNSAGLLMIAMIALLRGGQSSSAGGGGGSRVGE